MRTEFENKLHDQGEETVKELRVHEKFSELRKEFEDKLVEQRAQFEKRLLVLEDTIGADRSVCELKMHENCESRFCKHEENLSAIFG